MFPSLVSFAFHLPFVSRKDFSWCCDNKTCCLRYNVCKLFQSRRVTWHFCKKFFHACRVRNPPKTTAWEAMFSRRLPVLNQQNTNDFQESDDAVLWFSPRWKYVKSFDFALTPLDAEGQSLAKDYVIIKDTCSIRSSQFLRSTSPSIRLFGGGEAGLILRVSALQVVLSYRQACR